jgi:hypothetical protein
MHVDNVEKGKNRNSSSAKYHGKEKPDNGKETRTCYNCGKPGHLSKNCRQPKNKVFRQVNMIESNGPNDYEEWEVLDPIECNTNPYEDEDPSNPQFATRDLNEEERRELRAIGPDSPASDSMDGMYANSTTSSTDLTKEVKMAPGVEAPKMVNLEDVGIFTDRENRTIQTRPEDVTIEGQDYIREEKKLKPREDYRPIMGDCRAPEHYPEPHPGKRVDVWAYQEDTSPQYYRDNTDSVFYTPPDSPTLKREDATVHQKIVRASPFEQRKARKPRSRKTRNDAVYVNSNEALALYEEDTVRSAQQARETMTTPDYEDWVDRAEQKWAKKQKHYYKISSQPPQPNYALDFRNPRHVYLTWAACGYDECQRHYHDKCDAEHFPRKDGCKWAPYDCPHLECPKHLIDKRLTGVFPGLPDKEAQTLSLLVNGKCTQDLWQLCLNEDCTRHADVKTFNGFDQPTKPFLGRKQLWPNTVTKSTQHPSTSSR